MISGRPLLHGIAPIHSLNVWIFNGEDPIEEMHRRLAASAKLYGIKSGDCNGRLFVDSGRDTKFVIAEAKGGGLTIVRPIVDAIKQRIIENNIDVLVVDPFVSTHRVIAASPRKSAGKVNHGVGARSMAEFFNTISQFQATGIAALGGKRNSEDLGG